MARDAAGPVKITYVGGLPAVIVGGQITVERGGTISVAKDLAADLIDGGDFVPAAKAGAARKKSTTATAEVEEENES